MVMSVLFHVTAYNNDMLLPLVNPSTCKRHGHVSHLLHLGAHRFCKEVPHMAGVGHNECALTFGQAGPVHRLMHCICMSRVRPVNQLHMTC